MNTLAAKIENERLIKEIQLLQEQASQRNQIAGEIPTTEDPSVIRKSDGLGNEARDGPS